MRLGSRSGGFPILSWHDRSAWETFISGKFQLLFYAKAGIVRMINTGSRRVDSEKRLGSLVWHCDSEPEYLNNPVNTSALGSTADRCFIVRCYSE